MANFLGGTLTKEENERMEQFFAHNRGRNGWEGYLPTWYGIKMADHLRLPKNHEKIAMRQHITNHYPKPLGVLP